MLIFPAANIDEQSLVFNQRLIKMRRLIKDTLEIFSGSGDITVRYRSQLLNRGHYEGQFAYIYPEWLPDVEMSFSMKIDSTRLFSS